GAALMAAFERHFLGNTKIVSLGLVPFDEADGFRWLASLDFDLDAIAQELVNGLVVPVERAAVVICLGAELVDGAAYLRRGVAAAGEVSGEQPFHDVAVAVAVADVAVAEFIAKKGNDTILRGTFGVADGHGWIS